MFTDFWPRHNDFVMVAAVLVYTFTYWLTLLLKVGTGRPYAAIAVALGVSSAVGTACFLVVAYMLFGSMRLVL